MTLNQNSISAKLYRWFYDSETLPKNLCPYFWKLVWAYLFALPKLILGPSKKSAWGKIMGGFWMGLNAGWLIAFGLFFLYCNIFHLIPCLCGAYSYNSKLATWAAATDLSLIGIAIIVFLIVWIHDTFFSDEEKKEDRKYLAFEFVKAKYGKFCPSIEWRR